MPEIARATIQPSSQQTDPGRSGPAHGIPDVARQPSEIYGRGNWYRIFGLIHMLCSAEDDGPVSRIRY
jgi:hypothetical protein